MQQSDYDDFIDIIQVVGEQYSKRLSGGVIALYWQGLQDYELNAVKDALGKHLRNPDTGMFMPKIADIIRMLQGSTQDAALIAWAKVDRAVRHVGVYETVVFDDALIHSVLASMGGWLWLCGQDNEAYPHIARNFETAYRGFKARGEIPPYPPKLIGISEAHNGKEGFVIKPPTLIGDADKARMTMEGGSDKPVIAITAMRATEVLRVAA